MKKDVYKTLFSTPEEVKNTLKEQIPEGYKRRRYNVYFTRNSWKMAEILAKASRLSVSRSIELLIEKSFYNWMNGGKKTGIEALLIAAVERKKKDEGV